MILSRSLLRWIAVAIPEALARALTRLFGKKLVAEIEGPATEAFVEALLAGMSLAFCLSRDYRRSIGRFRARYLLTTSDGRVKAAAVFADGDLAVEGRAARDDGWDARVTFSDPAALRNFLLAKDPDVISAVIDGAVDLDGNLNLVYKLAFLARDLERRLGE